MAEQTYSDEIKEKEEKKEESTIVSIQSNEEIVFDSQQKIYGKTNWLPHKKEMDVWRKGILSQARIRVNNKESYPSSIQAVSDLIDSNPVINELANKMILQQQLQNEVDPIPQSKITSVDEMLQSMAIIISTYPKFEGAHLIGVPLAALFTGVNATLAGIALWQIDEWNKTIKGVLVQWNSFLNTPDSFPANNSWLQKTAEDKWAPPPIGMDLWVLPSSNNPYWNSWNHFFARDINTKYRPIEGGVDNNNVINSTNDGGLFRWRSSIQLTDTFWLKGMPYSLNDIFGSDDTLKYAAGFVNGSIWQTFLSPFNYHRWWSPVTGTIKIATVIPGCYYSKLIVPDYEGATTASCPYLTEANARGIVVIDTTGYANIGLICCIPIGMVEVSSILYEDYIKPGYVIKKGEKLGYFNFGGSSFVTIFENLSQYGKSISFQDINGKVFPTDGTTSPDGNPSNPINVGQQFALISST